MRPAAIFVALLCLGVTAWAPGVYYDSASTKGEWDGTEQTCCRNDRLRFGDAS